MNFEIGGHLFVDVRQELLYSRRAVTPEVLPMTCPVTTDSAARGLLRRDGDSPSYGARAFRGPSGNRSGLVQRLNLALLVHTENQSIFRGAQVQPHDVAHLLMKKGSVDSMKPSSRCGCREPEGTPDLSDCGVRQADLGGQHPG